jgi:hypothetical protein
MPVPDQVARLSLVWGPLGESMSNLGVSAGNRI